MILTSVIQSVHCTIVGIVQLVDNLNFSCSECELYNCWDSSTSRWLELWYPGGSTVWAAPVYTETCPPPPHPSLKWTALQARTSMQGQLTSIRNPQVSKLGTCPSTGLCPRDIATHRFLFNRVQAICLLFLPRSIFKEIFYAESWNSERKS
jgi:hypothetical protein